MKPIETKSLVLLRHHLKLLRLPTMHDQCEKLAARCAQENVDHLAFLLQLCELELLDRERRSTQRRLRFARFPNHKTLDNFKFESQPSLNRLLVAELMRCQGGVKEEWGSLSFPETVGKLGPYYHSERCTFQPPSAALFERRSHKSGVIDEGVQFARG